ncbi:conserved hypothetical protein [Vibrio chagasii]|nr:conserved hypothetical protein [Vibrio chagasii]
MINEIYPNNILGSVDWQRSTAELFKTLISNKQEWLDQYHAQFWDDWYHDVFNLDSANEFGLTVWSLILDEPVYSETEDAAPTPSAIGFGDNFKNFNASIFGVNRAGLVLSIEQKRILLKLKAFCLHTTCSVRDINVGLNQLFSGPYVVCFDNLDMSFTYFINDQIPKAARRPEVNLTFINEILKRDLFPRPSSVSVDVDLLSNLTNE